MKRHNPQHRTDLMRFTYGTAKSPDGENAEKQCTAKGVQSLERERDE